MTSQAKSLETVRQKLRAQMPVAQEWAYFDHAAVAPLTAPAAKAMQDWSAAAASKGDTVWLEWAAGVEQTRHVAAQLIGARQEEIALLPNTTAGISLVSEGIDWRPGDNVVTLEDEFPSNLYPWMNLVDRGVETRRVATHHGRVDADRLAAACDARTRIVSVSWVGYANGYRRDLDQLAAIAHDQGALFFVDAIQGLGVFPLDVSRTPIDFLAADGHKWMLGPEGAGIAYIRHERLERLRPFGVGWHSVVHAHDFSQIELKLKPSAERYEGGSQNMAGFLALGASLELLSTLGLEHLSAALLEWTDQACERLQAIGADLFSDRGRDHREGEQRSGIVTFEMPGRDPEAVRKHCLSQKVVLSARGGRLRISPHAYNNGEDLDRLIEALRS